MYDEAAPGRQRPTSPDAPPLTTFDVAAALSVHESGGDAEALSTVVAEHALHHCWEALRQYAAIRSGPARALELLAELETRTRDVRAAESPAGPRAFLYAALRSALPGTAPALAPLDPAWWTPPDRQHAEALVRIRASLDPVRFELAELAFARGLRAREIAFVTRMPLEEVERALQEIPPLARGILGDAPRSVSGTLEGALLEAFALRHSGQRRPSVPLLAKGDVVADRYRIEAHLGTGSFADVYRAIDLHVPDHVVALKLFRRLAKDLTARESAVRELRLIASVSHPSVVQFKDYGWHAGRAFFVMPFYRGETLRERIQRAPLTRVEAKAIFVPLARALAAMHRSGIRHQDVKPENIFLARPDEGDDAEVVPVLIDLGVAAKDAESVLAGTPNYFAPEVAARFAREPDPPMVTGKADVFSLALALRNALDPDAEESVIGGAVEAFVRDRARRAPPPPTKRDLAFLRGAFERWLHVAPDLRPTAEEFARELSILTRPEERRARAIGILRWLAPATITFLGIFAAVVLALSRESELHRRDAERARALADFERSRANEAGELAALMRADLERANETSRALKEDVARLEEEYRTSRLTRQELAIQLANTEGALSLLEKRRETQVAALEQALHEVEAERDELRTALETALAEQAKERDTVLGLAQQVGELRSELDAARRERDEARRQSGELQASLEIVRDLLERSPACAAMVVPPGPHLPTSRGVEPGAP